ncbi:MAG TPA: alpha/beta hydrolase [Feifaniaceae bacterium]|nr:alpha/beta hydrolase [Feifaniaceae bacterium]
MNKKSYFEEYVSTNGIETYLLHYPEDSSKPVLLFVHGGPGESTVPFMRFFKTSFGSICSLVTYDQRGTGRTLLKNPAGKPEMRLLLEDLHAVIAHLKQHYQVSKIALIGQSWGSGLGSVYALEHPEDLLCYIGVGQLIDGQKNERVGCEMLRAKILEADNSKDLAALDAIGEYPFGISSPFSFDKLMRVRKLQRKYGLAVRFGASFFKAVLCSPHNGLSGLKAAKASFAANREMIEWVMTTFSLYERPARYDTPVFYLLGDRDYQTPFPIASAYFDSIEAPYKQLVTIKNAGHFPQLDNLPDFVTALQQALEKAELLN